MSAYPSLQSLYVSKLYLRGSRPRAFGDATLPEQVKSNFVIVAVISNLFTIDRIMWNSTVNSYLPGTMARS